MNTSKAKYLPALILLFLSGIAVNAVAQEKSRVQSFVYGPFGDNINGTLEGHVYYSDKSTDPSGALAPLEGAQVITFESTGKIFKMAMVDNNGAFSMEMLNGPYKLSFVKKDYQTIIVTNYVSVADQFSTIKVILEKGTGIEYFKIPDWKQ